MSPDRDDRSEAPDPDVDALFAQIVAGWDEEQTTPVPPWPATEDLPERTGQDSSGGGRQARDRTDPSDRREDRAPGDRPERRVARPDLPGAGTGPQGRDRRASGPAGPRQDGPSQTGPAQTGPAQTGPSPTDPSRTGPSQTGPSHGPASGTPSGTTRPAATGPAAGSPGLPAPGPRDWAAADEPDEGFVPPEPPPLPRGDLVSRLAWAGVLFGPALLLLTAFLWDDAGPLPLALGTLAFVGGFVTLVARMPARRDDSDDDGAVV